MPKLIRPVSAACVQKPAAHRQSLEAGTISRDDLVQEVNMRKAVEEKLRRSNDGIKMLYKELVKTNAKLKEFDQRKDDFVNNVSHEIRTPLSIIRENISQVSDGLFGKVPVKQKRYLDKSLVNVDRLANIITDLLDVAKIENMKLQLYKAKVNMTSLVEDVVSDFERKVKAKGLELKCELPDTDVNASIDQEKIIQVFVNLMSNAIKFTPKGHIRISIEEKDDVVECHIADTGKGIAQEDLPKLFNKFEQIGRHHGSDEKGTGLGLTISKGIVELHGGKMSVVSEKGKGSTFTFTLPKNLLHEGVIQNLKSVLLSAIEKFNQFTVIKLNIDTPKDQLKVQSAIVNKLLRACLYRKVDDVVQDGRKIYILLPGTKKADCTVVIERIKRDLKQHDNAGVHLDVQVTSYPDDGLTEDELIWKLLSEEERA
jgi:signal transduction histidine kinase